jgi:hypothetical protein
MQGSDLRSPNIVGPSCATSRSLWRCSTRIRSCRSVALIVTLIASMAGDHSALSGQVPGTLTRHALRFAAPILALVIAMIVAPLGAGLMLRIRKLPGERAGVAAALIAAVPAAPCMTPAGEERTPTPTALCLEQHNDRHAARRDPATEFAFGVQA